MGLSATRDPRSDAPFAEPSAIDVVVVPAIGVDRSRFAAGPDPLAPHRRRAIAQRRELGDVVGVGAGQRDPQRDTVPVGQHMVFRARPCAVNRTRTDFWAASPAPGLHRRGIDRGTGEVRAIRRPRPVQQYLPKLTPHTGRLPLRQRRSPTASAEPSSSLRNMTTYPTACLMKNFLQGLVGPSPRRGPGARLLAGFPEGWVGGRTHQRGATSWWIAAVAPSLCRHLYQRSWRLAGCATVTTMSERINRLDMDLRRPGVTRRVHLEYGSPPYNAPTCGLADLHMRTRRSHHR